MLKMDEYALVGISSEAMSNSVNLDGARRMALKHIDAFVLTFSDQQAFAAVAASSAPAALGQVTDNARITEAGHLRRRVAVFRRAYTKKDGQPINPEAAQMIEKLEDFRCLAGLQKKCFLPWPTKKASLYNWMECVC